MDIPIEINPADLFQSSRILYKIIDFIKNPGLRLLLKLLRQFPGAKAVRWALSPLGRRLPDGEKPVLRRAKARLAD